MGWERQGWDEKDRVGMTRTRLGYEGYGWDEKEELEWEGKGCDEKKDKVGWDGEGLDENVLTTMRGNM